MLLGSPEPKKSVLLAPEDLAGADEEEPPKKSEPEDFAGAAGVGDEPKKSEASEKPEELLWVLGGEAEPPCQSSSKKLLPEPEETGWEELEPPKKSEPEEAGLVETLDWLEPKKSEPEDCTGLLPGRPEPKKSFDAYDGEKNGAGG